MAFNIDMSPLERSSRGIGNTLGSIGGVISNAIKDNRRAEQEQQLLQQQQAQQEQMRGLMLQAAQGDQQAIEQLYAVNPDIAKQFEDRVLGQQNRAQGERAMATADAVEKLHFLPDEQKEQMFNALVDDERYDIDEDDRPYFMDPNARKAVIAQVKGKEYADNLFGGETKFEQGKGDMSGYAFNPDTGEFSINPQMKAKMEALKENPVLDVGDRKDIQKDITSLTKDTKLIRNTAADLEKLGKVRSGPAAIAMIFKFMKALDPTSVVRESEFATAESAAGMPEAIKNAFDKVWAGERLGDEQIRQFIATAKNLANSAIDSSTSEVTSFLDTFEGTIPKTFVDLTMKRIPKRFAVEESATAPTQKATNEDVSEADIYARYGINQ